MNQDIITSAPTALAIRPDQTEWTPAQADVLRHIGLDRATRADATVFLHVCQRTGLDPFARQIYMIKRGDKQTIQTGIDGYRLVARRAADAAGHGLSYKDKGWLDSNGNFHRAWLRQEPPAAAVITVVRNGGDFPAVALMAEYNDTRSPMWKSRPAGQLMKCAEALALRAAFPQDLSGIYTDDEMHQADAPATVTADDVLTPDADEAPATLDIDPEDGAA